jgi:colicin import membrane protein
MIKNILYSLFLHSLIFILINHNFTAAKIDNSKISEITVSIEGVSSIKEKVPTLEKIITPKEEPKKEEIKPKEEENRQQIKKKAKAKPKPKKAIKKLPANEQKSNFKEIEPQEKQQESTANKEEIKKDEEEEKEKTLLNKTPSKKPKQEQLEKINNEKNAEKKDDLNYGNNGKITDPQSIGLSAREKLNIQSQLRRCYKMAINEAQLDGKIKVIVKVQIDRDGIIDFPFDQMVDSNRYNNPTEIDYKKVVDSVRKAVDFCSPLRNLPPEKYDAWKDVVLEFNDD